MSYHFDPLAPTQSEAAARDEATHGSQALLNHLKRAKQIEPDRPQIHRSHEDELALIASGKGHCVEWNIRKPDPLFTQAGVTEALY